MDQDLYAESVAKNLAYLRTVLCDSRNTYRSRLRRGGIVDRLAL